MELEIKLFASLRKFNPELERIEVDDGTTVTGDALINTPVLANAAAATVMEQGQDIFTTKTKILAELVVTAGINANSKVQVFMWYFTKNSFNEGGSIG